MRIHALVLSLWARIYAASIVFVLSATSICAQIPSWPYDGDFGKGYDVVFPNYTYKGFYESLRKIDFKNFPVRLFFEGQRAPDVVALKRGKSEKSDRLTYDSYELIAVYYLKNEKDGIERALLLLDEFYVGGSSSNGTFVQLLELSGGQLTLTQQIQYDRDALRTERHHYFFDPKRGILIIHASHYMPGDAHCCISAVDSVIFRWTGPKFVRRGVKTEHSEYGTLKQAETKSKKKP
jgi:hypothetical protein